MSLYRGSVGRRTGSDRGENPVIKEGHGGTLPLKDVSSFSLFRMATSCFVWDLGVGYILKVPSFPTKSRQISVPEVRKRMWARGRPVSPVRSRTVSSLPLVYPKESRASLHFPVPNVRRVLKLRCRTVSSSFWASSGPTGVKGRKDE